MEKTYSNGDWLVRVSNGVAEVIINRPPLNLITLEMRRDLGRIINELEQDSNVRVVIFEAVVIRHLARAVMLRNS
ncbi:enoyl-CoA hydratase/isomerase family protein [Vulcanisaeta sp. JCM 16159]|uniref:enoyl-CoA hydratase/isomerase family protein n=1 Tax=Vulcanisaeta sp. JCM 16159 TaxID=1295371 RepID=UPI000A695D43|nr:hypothetical protein [Vulcanisaeta sp. JCM 16159]